MRRRLVALLGLVLGLAAGLPTVVGAAPSAALTTVLVVSPQGPFTTLAAAVQAAREGDTVEVRGGVYRGSLTVAKTVRLEGVGWPVLDGGGQGTVVTLAAPDIVFRGFEVRGSGSEPHLDHAGITVTAPRVVVEGNRLRDVLFGIFVAQAESAVIRGNTVTSKDEYDLGRKGDGLRLWYSPRVLIEGNTVSATRDVVIWYSSDVTLRDNLVQDGRYGVHLMYCDRVTIERNRLVNNSVGIYTMYSSGTWVRENVIRGQRGPSGYALGFKDADNVEVTHNALVDNRVGVFLDGTPFTPQSYSRFEANVLAFNDVGVILQPAVHNNTFAGNAFWENVEQVGVQGGGQLERNQWQGNYWSDYTGFDANEDGRGDTPYHAERTFEHLTDREPRLRALLYSPTVQAIEFAAAAFPIVRPQPKLTDATPLVQPPDVAAFVQPTPGGERLGLVGAGLVALGLLAGGLAVWRRTSPGQEGHATMLNCLPRDTAAAVAVRGRGITKTYGETQALTDVSFEVRHGEAVALWGANGAGKTTLIKALLGLIETDGVIEVEGQPVGQAGKAVRACIGYVPQETAFYDLTVDGTLAFYGRLKKVGAARRGDLLARLGLSEHRRKPVAALSGGLKQRLALALALLANPPILLLDEPTASLDVAGRRDYLALLAELRREGKTLLFASHRLDEVETLADRVLILDEGEVMAEVTPAELRRQLTSPVTLSEWLTPALDFEVE
ncbi:MAG: nitrous oxide reductase family maturation protein NosD [Anaerolineae bacterium]|nr:nitrous oxide reductase family maturation protein NosD [Anaerolineae bacterium]